MRVTNTMISSQVVFNLNRSLSRYMEMESMMSSGRRINVPSDDPSGAQKDMQYRTILAQIEQFQKNNTYGLSRQVHYESTIREIEQMAADAYVLAVGLSNGDYDANSRLAAADEIKGLYEAIVSQANAQVDGRYLYSGFRTRTQAFVTGPRGVVYMGDTGQLKTEIEPGSKMQINLIGSDVFMKRLSVLGDNANLESGIDGASLLSDLNLGVGIDMTTGQFAVTDNNRNLSVNLDISGATTLDDAITTINAQLAAGGITNLTLGYGAGGSELAWQSTQDGIVTNDTLLANLNNGNGVDLSLGKIAVRNGDASIDMEIDLSGANDIEDVINLMNAAFAAHPDPQVQVVVTSVNGFGRGLAVRDFSNLGLTISDMEAGSTTAADLGIAGDVGVVMNGEDLNPQTDFSVTEAGADQTTASDLGIIGRFNGNMQGNQIRPQLTADTSLSLLNGGHGLDLGQIRISMGREERIVDLGNASYTTLGDILDAINNSGLDIEASINPSLTGIQIIPTSSNTSFIIDEVSDGTTAHDLGIFGSPDLFGSMILLEDALRNDDQQVVGQLIENLDQVVKDLLSNQATVGTRTIRMEATQSRLSDMHYDYKKLLSEVEDADLTQLVTDLAMQETSYQAALMAASKILQPSLLDFLR